MKPYMVSGSLCPNNLIKVVLVVMELWPRGGQWGSTDQGRMHVTVQIDFKIGRMSYIKIRLFRFFSKF